MKDLLYSIVKAFKRKVVFYFMGTKYYSSIVSRNNTSPLSSFDRFIKYPYLLQFVKNWETSAKEQTITTMVLLYFLDRLSRF